MVSCAHSKKYIITGGSDGRVSVWNTETGGLMKSFETGNDEIRQLMISDGAIITAGIVYSLCLGSTGIIRIW